MLKYSWLAFIICLTIPSCAAKYGNEYRDAQVDDIKTIDINTQQTGLVNAKVDQIKPELSAFKIDDIKAEFLSAKSETKQEIKSDKIDDITTTTTTYSGTRPLLILSIVIVLVPPVFIYLLIRGNEGYKMVKLLQKATHNVLHDVGADHLEQRIDAEFKRDTATCSIQDLFKSGD